MRNEEHQQKTYSEDGNTHFRPKNIETEFRERRKSNGLVGIPKREKEKRRREQARG